MCQQVKLKCNESLSNFGFIFNLRHYTVDAASLESILALLDRGAKPDYETRDGSTPLIRAAVHGNLEVVAALIQIGLAGAGEPDDPSRHTSKVPAS